MSSTRTRYHVRRPVVVVVDIGCNCRRPKLSSFFPKQRKYPHSLSPSTTTTTTTSTTNTYSTTSSFSPSSATSSPCTMTTKPTKRKAVKNGVVAVEKESSDPYVDFRDSMLQMIVEKEIYSWDGLRELLHLFLSLNSPSHHHLILRAFTEIWNGK